MATVPNWNPNPNNNNNNNPKSNGTNSYNNEKESSNDIPVAYATTIDDGIRPELLYQNHSSTLTDESYRIISSLRTDQNFPSGLAEELVIKCRTQFPLRFWIIDNSGSMRNSDGTQLHNVGSDSKNNPKFMVAECSRWTELKSTVDYHIRLAHQIQLTTYFRLLNDPGVRIGPQEFTVATNDPSSSSSSTIIKQDPYDTSTIDSALSIMNKCTPSGVTPLTIHIQEIYRRMSQVEYQLRNAGQTAVIVIATDGLPSDSMGECDETIKHEFIQALKLLQSLPVWIVIRLCTSERAVVDYYNALDSVLELPLEVIDDYFAEAIEITKVNSWLTYGIPLHRCRELGYTNRLFDLLDERSFNLNEIYEFCCLLFGTSSFRNAPNINTNFYDFITILEHVVKTEGKIYSSITNQVEYWIDIKKLIQLYKTKNRNTPTGQRTNLLTKLFRMNKKHRR